MLYCDRIDISKGIDPARCKSSKESMVFQYWVFNHEFKFQDSFCNGCQDLTVLCLNIREFTIITVLLMTLANLMQFICSKIMCLMIVGTRKNLYQRNQYQKSILQLLF